MTPSRTPTRRALVAAAVLTAFVCALATVVTSSSSAAPTFESPEAIYVLRSIRERQQPAANGCSLPKTGFEPAGRDSYFVGPSASARGS